MQRTLASAGVSAFSRMQCTSSSDCFLSRGFRCTDADQQTTVAPTKNHNHTHHNRHTTTTQTTPQLPQRRLSARHTTIFFSVHAHSKMGTASPAKSLHGRFRQKMSDSFSSHGLKIILLRPRQVNGRRKACPSKPAEAGYNHRMGLRLGCARVHYSVGWFEAWPCCRGLPPSGCGAAACADCSPCCWAKACACICAGGMAPCTLRKPAICAVICPICGDIDCITCTVRMVEINE